MASGVLFLVNIMENYESFENFKSTFSDIIINNSFILFEKIDEMGT